VVVGRSVVSLASMSSSAVWMSSVSMAVSTAVFGSVPASATSCRMRATSLPIVSAWSSLRCRRLWSSAICRLVAAISVRIVVSALVSSRICCGGAFLASLMPFI
jgi:hypothetical protein